MMDSIDHEIIKILQGNARCTVSEISSKINLSIPAVSERIRKLEDSGIIRQYTAILDPEKTHKNLEAIMFVSLGKAAYDENLINFINQEDEILECNYTTGDFDYALKIITSSTKTLESLLRRIKNIKGVIKTHTIVVLCNIKRKYSVSP